MNIKSRVLVCHPPPSQLWLILPCRRLITRFHSKPDFFRRKIHQILRPLPLIIFFFFFLFFRRVLLHCRRASVNVAAGSSRGSKRSVNLRTPFRRASVTPFSHSEIRQPSSPRLSVFPTCRPEECALMPSVFPILAGASFTLNIADDVFAARATSRRDDFLPGLTSNE